MYNIWNTQGLVVYFEDRYKSARCNAIDKVWLTCCLLHNWLLEIDGLGADWDSQTLPLSSEWKGEMGQINTEGLSTPYNYNTSSMGHGADINESEERQETPSIY